MKNVLIVHDISCYGKNSTTAVLPIISAMQLVGTLLPTALLSTHTGPGFEDYTFLDLSSEMVKIVGHWQQMGLRFDSIYVGYLGSSEQIDFLQDVIPQLLTSNGQFFLDPVMADDGEFYANFDQSYAEKMRNLCQQADVLIPNQTEASFLYHEPYQEGLLPLAALSRLQQKINTPEPTSFVLTGAGYDGQGLTGAYYWDQTTQQGGLCQAPFVGGRFHGTGDIFASILVGLMTNGWPLAEATRQAVTWVSKILSLSIDNPKIVREGLQFERVLGDLAQLVRQGREEDEG